MDELLRKLFKDTDALVSVLVFLIVLVGPILKAILQKKGQKPSRDFGGDEDDDRPIFFPEEDEKPVSPPEPPPVFRRREPEPIAPIPRTQKIQRSRNIDEEVLDIEEGVRSVAAEAESVDDADIAHAAAFENQIRKDLPTLEVTSAPLEVTEEASESRGVDFDQFSPMEAAIVFGGSLERPLSVPSLGR